MYSLAHELEYSICQHFLSREKVDVGTSPVGLHRLGTTAAKASQVRVPPCNAITANTYEKTRSTSAPTGSTGCGERLVLLRFFQNFCPPDRRGFP